MKGRAFLGLGMLLVVAFVLYRLSGLLQVGAAEASRAAVTEAERFRDIERELLLRRELERELRSRPRWDGCARADGMYLCDGSIYL